MLLDGRCSYLGSIQNYVTRSNYHYTFISFAIFYHVIVNLFCPEQIQGFKKLYSDKLQELMFIGEWNIDRILS